MKISWLLFRTSVRQSAGRLGLTAGAIALGTMVLLGLAAGVNGLMSRASNVTWISAAAEKKNKQPIESVSPLKVSFVRPGNIDMWQNQQIELVSVYETGANAPKIPGLPVTPKPGEYYMSEALAKLDKEHPDAGLASRNGTKYLGTLPAGLTQSPDSLVVVRGADAKEAEMKLVGDRDAFESLYQFDTSGIKAGYGMMGMLLLAFGGTILLFPIVMFVAVATQLGSAQREQRYAAIRLIGGTRTQVTKALLFESLVATIGGIIIGSLVYLAALPLLQQYQFGGERFWPNDMTVQWSQYGVIVGLTILLSLAANWWGMRHVQTSPLGVARKQKVAKKPRLWRALPLLVGLGIFGWLSTDLGKNWVQSHKTDVTPMIVLILGIMLVMFGLVLAGSWLTYVVARLVARRTKRAGALIAGQRIAGQSKQVFRSVSGVVLALFAGSFYLTVVGGVDKLNADSISDNGYSQLQPDTALAMVRPRLDKDISTELRQQPYVQSLEVVYRADREIAIPCQVLTTYTKLSCPDDKKYALVDFDGAIGSTVKTTDTVDTTAPANYLIKLDSNDHIDQLRTQFAKLTNDNNNQTWRYLVSGTYEQLPKINPVIKSFAEMVYAGITLTMSVAVGSMLVATIGGLLERRRSLLTLRLGGMTIGQMKRIVMIESLIPLFSVSLLAGGLGIWIGYVFLTLLTSEIQPTVTPLYGIIVGGLLLAAIIGIYLILPMIRKITSLEENRTE